MGGYYGNVEVLNNILRTIFIDVLCFTMLPTFFLLSGMLFYSRKEHYEDRVKTFWKKFDRLMIPYALVFMLCSFINIPKIGIAESSGHLWFVKYLFFYFCIALLFYRIKEIYVFVVSLLCFLCYCLQTHLGIVIDGETGRLMQYGVFFYGGFGIARYFHWLRRNRYLKWMILLVWLFALFVHQQTISTLLFNIVLLAFIPSSTVKNKVLLYLDKQSFRVYLIHHVVMFILFAMPCFQWLYTWHDIVAIAAMFMVLIIISLLICEILSKIKFRYF